MNASIGQWLNSTGRAGSGYRVSQGTRLGRAGDVSVSVDDGAVWVGGRTVTCVRGLIAV